MLAASRFGITNRLARPLSVVCGNMRWRSASSQAVSACISPSMSSLGARALRICQALRIFAALGLSWLP